MVVRKEGRIIVPDGDLSMPQIRQLVRDDELAQERDQGKPDRNQRIINIITRRVEKRLKGLSDEELAETARRFRELDLLEGQTAGSDQILKDIVVGHMLRGAKHYLLNVLSGAMLGVERIERERAAGHAAAETDIRRTSKVIHTIDAFFRTVNSVLATGKKAEYRQTDIRSILADVVGTQENLGAAFFGVKDPERLSRLVDVEVNVAADAESVTTDRARLTYSITNCVMNSLQAMDGAQEPAGQRHRLRVDVAKADVGGRDYMRITISDTGYGFDGTVKARMMAGHFSTKGVDGTGLGVSETKRMAKDLGGDFDIESPGKGKGSTATILLPMR